MSDPVADLRARVEQLEARLADATAEARFGSAEVRRLRDEYVRRACVTRSVMAVIVAMTLAVFWTTVPGQTAGPMMLGPTKIKGSFQVVDGSDHLIMSVGSGPGGRSLTLYRENNELAFRAGIAKDLGNPGLALYRFDGSFAVRAGIPDVGPSNPYLKVQSPNDLSNIAIGLQDSNPLLVVRSGDPRSPVAALGAVGGRPRLDMTNLNGGGVVTIEQTAAGNGAIILSNAQGQATVLAGTSAQGVGKVEVLPGYLPMGSVAAPATVIQGLRKK